MGFTMTFSCMFLIYFDHICPCYLLFINFIWVFSFEIIGAKMSFLWSICRKSVNTRTQFAFSWVSAHTRGTIPCSVLSLYHKKRPFLQATRRREKWHILMMAQLPFSAIHPPDGTENVWPKTIPQHTGASDGRWTDNTRQEQSLWLSVKPGKVYVSIPHFCFLRV